MFGAATPTSASLVQSPDAADFVGNALLPHRRKLLLGDPQKYDGRVLNAINEAHVALEDGAKKIAALANDPTRNEVQRHAAAKQVAERVAATIERSQASIAKLAVTLDEEAQTIVDDAFKLRSDRGGVHDAMIKRFGEIAKRETGLTEIRNITAKDREAAAVIVNTPAWLLGIAEDAHSSIMGDAIKRHAPKAAIASAHALEVAKLADKYPKAARSVHRTFYSTALADKAKNRVEV